MQSRSPVPLLLGPVLVVRWWVDWSVSMANLSQEPKTQPQNSLGHNYKMPNSSVELVTVRLPSGSRQTEIGPTPRQKNAVDKAARRKKFAKYECYDTTMPHMAFSSSASLNKLSASGLKNSLPFFETGKVAVLFFCNFSASCEQARLIVNHILELSILIRL